MVLAGMGWLGLVAAPPVVINEIHYHPTEDRDALQWIELHNPGKEAVDLAGWKFSKGIRMTFGAGTTLPPGGHGVIVQDRKAFTTQHGSDPMLLGQFEGRLKRSGERLELVDAGGAVVDSVRFADATPWPVAADGFGATLERVRAEDPGEDPFNWAPSPWGGEVRRPGTPGRPNATRAEARQPRILAVTYRTNVLGEAQLVKVRIGSEREVKTAVVKYQVATAKGIGEEKVIGLERVGGTAEEGEWAGEVPAVGEERVVRFWVEVRDAMGVEGRWPRVNDVRPTGSYLSWKSPLRGMIGQMHVWDGGRMEPAGQRQKYVQKKQRLEPSKPRGMATVLYVPARGAGEVELRDHVRVGVRSGGWKVRFNKDAALGGLRTVNVVSEGKPRWMLSEHLSYELFRRSRVLTPHSELVRWVRNGESEGYHLLVEQPNDAFLGRHGRDTDGNLYKILWYGQGLNGQHEKKNHPDATHAELQAVVKGLQTKSGAEGWTFIDGQFQVESFLDYYVVSQCIQNWDGYFNNHFVHRSSGENGKWEIIPWDEDKTWGDHDGANARYDWYGMPLTYGKIGDPQPAGPRFGGMFGGGTTWWRPGGWFSGPLLAHPEFEKRYRARLREFLDKEFTEERFGPVIDDLGKRLEWEVKHRAEVRGSTEESLLREFREDIASFRRQLVGRRAFLLKALP